MRFDWYAASFDNDVHPMAVLDALRSRLDVAEVRESRGLHGYHQRFQLLDSGGHEAASVLCGGVPVPHAWASGSVTPAFVDAVRADFPCHRVTRMDAAEDFDAAGCYDMLRDLCRSVRERAGVKGREILPDQAEDGRTYYLGAPSSPTRCRLYEKGLQERARTTGDPALISPTWTRLEAQVRPQKLAREAAATATPEQAWGYARWLQLLGDEALALDVPRVKGRIRQASDDERALSFLVKQYAGVLERLRFDLGDWACVGLQLGELVTQHRQHKR